MTVRNLRAALPAALLVCVAAAISAPQAFAAARLSAYPLQLVLPSDKLTTSLTLGNRDSSVVTMQAEIVAWDQSTGEDRYSPAPELVVSPAIFNIVPGASQLVRVGRLKRLAAPASELSYRIRLIQVPPAGPTPEQVVTTVLQLNMPVFVPPAVKSAPAIGFQVQAEGSKGLVFKLRNTGAVHAKIVRMSLLQNGSAVADRMLNYYVLPGAARDLHWPDALESVKSGATELRVMLDERKEIVQPLVIAPEARAAAGTR